MLNGGSLDGFLPLASMKGETGNFPTPSVSPGDTTVGLADANTALVVTAAARKLAPVQSESNCGNSS